MKVLGLENFDEKHYKILADALSRVLSEKFNADIEVWFEDKKDEEKKDEALRASKTSANGN